MPWLNQSRYSIGLLILGGVFITTHLTVVMTSGGTAHLSMSALFWLAILFLLGQKAPSFQYEQRLIPALVGGTLLAWVVANSAWILWNGMDGREGEPAFAFIRGAPFVTVLGLGLVASGFRHHKQLWPELTISFFMGVPSIFLETVDISAVTAFFSTVLLRLLGFEATLQELTVVMLPTGGVLVYSGCSGLDSMLYLLGLAVTGLLLFPVQKGQSFVVPFVAVAIAFVVNGARIAGLAVLSARNQEDAFNYWHIGQGSLVVGGVAVFLFGLFYVMLIEWNESKRIRD